MYLEAFKLTVESIKNIIYWNSNKKAKAFEAVEAIQRAANRTSIFITKSRQRTYKSNVELSDIWLDAAKAVRELDKDLYNRLLMKAEYWSNPEEWDNQKVDNARISLLEIKRDSRAFLKNKTN